MSDTSMYSHTYGDHDDSQNPRSSQDCGSRWRWTGSRNSIARLCAAMMRSPTYPALREATWDRGRKVEVAGGQGGRGRWLGGGGLMELCIPLLPWGLLYIGGRDATLPLPQGTKGGGQGDRGLGQRRLGVGPGRRPPKP
jgi:hypothetical protein